MTETQYALAWFRLRLTELRRVPLPDRNWLNGKKKVKWDRYPGLFDKLQ